MLLAPRTDEAFGLSVVEAMARGLPVVAAGSGGPPRDGGLRARRRAVPSRVTPTTPRGCCASWPTREEERESYGARLQVVQRERFTVEQQARSTDAVYRELL